MLQGADCVEVRHPPWLRVAVAPEHASSCLPPELETTCTNVAHTEHYFFHKAFQSQFNTNATRSLLQ